MFLISVIAAMTMAVLAAPAFAQTKHAFVVGIDKYDNLASDKQLQKAVGDAQAISDVLTGMGFAVVMAPNVTRPVFNERWQSFIEKINPGDTAAFVFSGHGVEISGANYLLPRDVPRLRLGRDELLKRESLALAEILADLRERRPGFSLIVLDACRDNPFSEGDKTVGAARGLARVEPPEGTFIMYSAGAHQTALDRLSEGDKATTSIYTRTLLPLLKMPGLSLLDMADRVGEQVRDLAATISHRQTPAFYSGVIGGRRVCLAGCAVVAPQSTAAAALPTAPAVGASAEAVRICREVEGMASLSMLAILERQHKGTPAADCVAARIDEIKRAEAAALADKERQRLAMLQQQTEAEHTAYVEAAKVNDILAWVAFLKAHPSGANAQSAKAQLANLRRLDGDTKAAEKAERDRVAAEQRKQEIAEQRKQEAAAEEKRKATETLRPGRVLRDCPSCPEMVIVPTGSFTMGSPANERERFDSEGPTRTVTIRRPFAVGKYEVTFAEWEACVAGGGCKSNRNPGDQGWGRAKRPVINVSWSDAKEYVAWLSATAKQPYRLLTEAEWEYAARAGTTTRYSFGDELSNASANNDKGRTVEVGQYAANRFGLHDMHGNVYEWVEDCWHDNYQGAPTDGSAWTSACYDAGRRVVRGGSWVRDPHFLRSAFRFRFTSGLRVSYLGFRVARTLNP